MRNIFRVSHGMPGHIQSREQYLRQQLELASELESDLRDIVEWRRKWLVGFNAEKTQLVLFDRSNNTCAICAIDVKMDRSVLEKKSYIKMLGFNYFSKLNKGSYIISIAKTASKKIGALICSMKSLSNEVAPFFSIGITLVDFYLNWLNWFHFIILEGDPLIILIDCIILCHNSQMLQGCLFQQFLSSHSQNPEFSYTEICCILYSFFVSFFCNSMPCCG